MNQLLEFFFLFNRPIPGIQCYFNSGNYQKYLYYQISILQVTPRERGRELEELSPS